MLYGGYYFRYRKCHRATYASQYERAFDRARSQAEKIRAKFGRPGFEYEYCFPEKPKWIRVYNRTQTKAEQLLTDLGRQMDVSRIEVVSAIDDLDVASADLLINTTSVGLKKDDPCPIEKDLLHRNMLVYDVIYNPPQTKLLRIAQEKKTRTANGLGMLFYQGVLAFQHWAEVEIEEKVKRVMRKALEEKAGDTHA